MLHDVEFLSAKLGKIEGFGKTSEYLTEIIKSKKVKDDESSTPSPQGEASEESSSEKKESDGDADKEAKP
jgi:vacuolar protein sorting-associated protein 54